MGIRPGDAGQTNRWADFQFHRDKTPYFYIALAMLVGVTAGLWWLRRSRIGFILRAIRDDEDAVRSLGFAPQRYKALAMAISAAILGAAGVFHAQYVLFVDPFSVLGLHISILVALFAILGGVGTLMGPVLGAAILVPLSEYTRVYFSGSGRNIDLLIYGFLIMVIAVYRPDGLVGLIRHSPLRISSAGCAGSLVNLSWKRGNASCVWNSLFNGAAASSSARLMSRQ